MVDRKIITDLEAKEDLYFYTRYAHFQQTGQKWRRNWHHDLITEHLEACYTRDIKRLIINIPPRYSKTQLAVRDFSSWGIGNDPTLKFLHTSYSKELALGNSQHVRDSIKSDWHRDIFDVNVKAGTEAKSKWETEQDGGMYAVGSGGAITGFGGDFILIDDPHKPKDVHSDTLRQSTVDWFGNTLYSRLNDKVNGVIVLIMQRLHEEDLSGFLLNGGNGQKWEHLNIRGEAEEKRSFYYFGGEKCKDVEEGDLLWPEFEPRAEYEITKRALGSYNYAGQYQQRPAPLEGGIFKTKWWKTYTVLPKMKYIIQIADTAQKTKQSNDYSVIATWGKCTEGNIYLLDLFRDKLEAPDLKKQFIINYNAKKPRRVYIEDKASGTSIIQDLKRTSKIPIRAVQRNIDKITRAMDVVPYIEAGYVYIPEDAHFMPDFIAEHSNFPNAPHDDMVDTTMDAIDIMLVKKGMGMKKRSGRIQT